MQHHPDAQAPSGRVLIIALGDLPPADVAAAVRARFGPRDVAWLERGELRRGWPGGLVRLVRLARQRYALAVLVAPDLGRPRQRLTSVLLGVPRAGQRWRMDLHGRCEPWGLGDHLVRNAWPIARHVLACGLTLALARPLLAAIERYTSVQTPARRGTTPRPSTGRSDSDRPGPANRVPNIWPARVLYLRSQLWLGLTGGGSVAHTAGVIAGLEQCGVQVDVVASDRLPGVSATTTLVPPETWFDGWRREVEELAYNAAFCLAALRVARRAGSQVIYQRHTAFTWGGALLARVLRVPLVLEFNSSEVWKGRYWGGLRLGAAAAAVERINLRAADLVVVVSEALRDQLAAAGVPPARILVNPNAVDPAQFRPDIGAAGLRHRLHLCASDVVIGFSGTFGEWHGIPTLARALAQVVQARPAARWLLIGDGPLRRLVEAAVAEQHLDARVTLAGMVPHAEMPAYLAACDILVSPHGRQLDGGEFFGSPTKLYEYMAAGKPIVASAVGQIARVLEDGRSALLVPPDDADALSEAIGRLVDDAALRARLGQAARQAAVTHHTWRQNAERLLAALASMGGEPAYGARHGSGDAAHARGLEVLSA